MRHRRRPLLGDARRTRACPVLAMCVIVIATLGLLLREQAQPDGLVACEVTALVAAGVIGRRAVSWPPRSRRGTRAG